MKRHDILNAFITKHKYKSYLEIGLDEGGHLNDTKVKCELKHSVDPATNSRATYNMTSDDYFHMNRSLREPNKYDIIFIDGLHHSDQVIRDIHNALEFLNAGGTIVLHDCNPTSEPMQRVPRMQGEWTGDVWKGFCEFRKYPFLTMYTVDTDYGCGVIQRSTGNRMVEIPEIPQDASYEDFNLNRKIWLNLIPIITFKAIMFDDIKMSVCIPAFEQYGFGRKHLLELFQSLATQDSWFEVVVSDNSTNNEIEFLCKEWASQLEIFYTRNPVRGISGNTNNAIFHAKEQKIKLMYMDDLLLESDALRLFSEALDQKEWAVSMFYSVDDKGKRYRLNRPTFTDDLLSGNNKIGMPSVTAFRKNEFTFDTQLKTLLDCEYYWLLRKAYGDPVIIDKAIVGSRYHKNSTSTKQGNFGKTEYEYLKRKHNIQ